MTAIICATVAILVMSGGIDLDSPASGCASLHLLKYLYQIAIVAAIIMGCVKLAEANHAAINIVSPSALNKLIAQNQQAS